MDWAFLVRWRNLFKALANTHGDTWLTEVHLFSRPREVQMLSDA